MKSDIPKDNTMQACIAATEEVIARINRLVDRTAPLEPEQLTEELTAAVDRLRETLRGMEELEDMQQADRALAEFPARLTHDMRALLNGIVGLLEICGQHPDDRQQHQPRQEKPRRAHRKRPDILHALALRDERRAPDHGTQEKKNTAFCLLVHGFAPLS